MDKGTPFATPLKDGKNQIIQNQSLPVFHSGDHYIKGQFIEIKAMAQLPNRYNNTSMCKFIGCTKVMQGI